MADTDGQQHRARPCLDMTAPGPSGNALDQQHERRRRTLAVGYRRAPASTPTGSGNVAVGEYALYSNMTGIQNAATGFKALTNSTGDYNLAIGFESSLNNTAGQGETATGDQHAALELDR